MKMSYFYTKDLISCWLPMSINTPFCILKRIMCVYCIKYQDINLQLKQIPKIDPYIFLFFQLNVIILANPTLTVPFSNPKSVSLVSARMGMSIVQEKIQSRIVQFWIVLSKIKSWRKDIVVQLVNWTFAHVVMIAIKNWQIVSMVFRTILAIVNKVSREMVPIVKVSLQFKVW